MRYSILHQKVRQNEVGCNIQCIKYKHNSKISDSNTLFLENIKKKYLLHEVYLTSILNIKFRTVYENQIMNRITHLCNFNL